MIGITALVVDGGNAFLEKRNAQNVADSVALGAALARIKGSQIGWANQAYEIAKSSGYEEDNPNRHIEIHSPPLNGIYSKDVQYIQVLITSHVATYFGSVIGIKEITVTAEAISISRGSQLLQMLNGNAVVSLAPTSDCQDNRSFWVHGESTLSVTGGGVFVNSNNPTCALITNGNGSIRVEEGWDIRVVGGADTQKPNLISPFPIQINSVPISYPPPFMMPKVGCSKDAVISADGETLSAGSWGEDVFPPDGVHYLQAGIYCVEGVDFHVKGNNFLHGANVVIQVEGGEVHFDGGAQIDLRAPQQGELEGLLLYEPINNHYPLTINMGPESSLKGSILAPGAVINLNNDDSATGYHSQIIGYMIHSDGQAIIKVKYTDEENYNAYTMPQVQLIK